MSKVGDLYMIVLISSNMLNVRDKLRTMHSIKFTIREKVPISKMSRIVEENTGRSFVLPHLDQEPHKGDGGPGQGDGCGHEQVQVHRVIQEPGQAHGRQRVLIQRPEEGWVQAPKWPDHQWWEGADYHR